MANGRGDGPARSGAFALTPVQTAARVKAALNYTITALDEIGTGTDKEKVHANVEAIRLLKALEDEARIPTEDEKRTLVRYVGWGAFAQAVFDTKGTNANARIWATERAELQSLLTSEEWTSARASTLNAHYTSYQVISGIWDAAQHLGFDGGRALEPSAGAGHFLGLIPNALKFRTAWSAVELDSLSGRIARALYPGADVRIEGFEKSRWPESYFDLAISNVPFGNYGVADAEHRHLSIHDYFFVKALQKLRPGGLVAFITSHYTLDKQGDAVRRAIANQANFLGAIRLPGGENGAFKANAGTEVTTDIVFLQKRDTSQIDESPPWIALKTVDSPDGPIAINEYFADHPEMMLGEMRLEKGQFATPQPVLIDGLTPDETLATTRDLSFRIAAAARSMPANVYRAALVPRPVNRPPIDTTGLQDRSFLVKDGRLYQFVDGEAIEPKLNAIDRAKVTDLVGMKDLVNVLLEPPEEGSDAKRALVRQRLNAAYHHFVRRYGPINHTLQTVSRRVRKDGTPVVLRRMPNFAAFREDPRAWRVAFIEDYDEQTGKAQKTAIFTHDLVRHPLPPEIKSATDALAVSLSETGRVDIDRIAELLHCDESEVPDALGDAIWLDPAGDVWRPAATYLSGDVVQKLEDARIASAVDERYLRNVTALEKIQPTPVTRTDITVLCGAPWVPVDVYRTFLEDVLNIKGEHFVQNDITKRWQFKYKPEVPSSTEAQYGTPRARAIDVIEAALGNGEIRIFDPNPDDTKPPIPNLAATEEANAKVAGIRETFTGSSNTGAEGWIWQDPDRAERIEALYNNQFNRLVRTVYDGSHLTLPGLARYIGRGDGQAMKEFKLRPHQVDAIWRIIESGNTLLDHCVGAGKTFTMICAGMELRRLGLVRTPWYNVPNSMLEQFSREFLQAYPAANILVADKESMTRDKRRQFAAKAASGSFDAVIITHDAMGRIPLSFERREQFMRDSLERLESFLAKTRADEGSDSITVKELEKAKKRQEAKLDKLMALDRKDQGITFEELGVDFLFVDEAHLFKNLAFQTRHKRVKGIPNAESQRATDLYMKIGYLEEQRPGRSTGFATATPLSNSMTEFWIMMAFLARPLLIKHGFGDFDSWAGAHGDIVTQVELAPSGRGFRTTRSFSRFVNIPELIGFYSLIADVQTAHTLNLPRPKLKNGTVTVVECELSWREQQMMEDLVLRAEAIKGKRPEKGGDNMLKILGEGLQLGTDIRLCDPTAPFNPNGKVAAATKRIHEIWRDGKKPALCQLVFCNMGVPGGGKRKKVKGKEDDDNDGEAIDDELAPPAAEGRINLYEDMRQRLVDMGIPREQIAFIHEADNDLKKAKLFEDMREGRVRILFGSIAKMGVGVNVQKHLCAKHDIDAPWRPSDLEQSDGRILRQGNLNEEVEIIRYITRKSLDAYRWQTLDRKAQTFAQIRAGARGVRVAEDIDSPLPDAAAIKAAATGNPLIMEREELLKEIRELEAAKRGQESSMIATRHAYTRAKETLAGATTRLDHLANDAECVALKADRPFSMQIDGATYTERKAAGEKVKSLLLAKGVNLPLGEARALNLKATLKDFKLEAYVRRGIEVVSYFVEIDRARSYSRADTYILGPDIEPVGLVRRFENLIRQIPETLAREQTEVEKTKANLGRLERQLTATAFAKNDRLLEIKKRKDEIERALDESQANKPAPSEIPDPKVEVEPNKMEKLRQELEADTRRQSRSR